MPLTDVHLLIVSNNTGEQANLVSFLQKQNAICHVAKTRTAAMGLYMALFTDDIVPRAVITDWYLNPPDSDEFKFYLNINRPEANTAKNLIRRLKQIDPAVQIIVHSAYLDDMIHEGLPVQVVQKGEPLTRIVDILTDSSSITRKTIKI